MTTPEERKLSVALGILSGRVIGYLGQKELSLLGLTKQEGNSELIKRLAEDIVFSFIKEALEK